MLKHLSLLLVGLLLGVLVFGFINFDKTQNVIEVILSGLLGVLIVYSAHLSNNPLNRILAWNRNTGLRLLLGIFWNFVSSYVLLITSIGLYKSITGQGEGWLSLSMEVQLKLGILLFTAAVIHNIVYFAFYSYNQYHREQLAQIKLQRRQAELQLSTLKAQLSPHFLFNCINALSVLFHTDHQKAETFIRAMSKCYQYTLDHYRHSLVKVSKELEFVESYAFLLKTRFGDGFQLKQSLDSSQLNRYVPPLTLQILVENAAKHNQTSLQRPITVHIKGNGSSNIKVVNNKVPIKRKKPSTGIGLKNIDARYKILLGSSISVEDGKNFTVKLPLFDHE